MNLVGPSGHNPRRIMKVLRFTKIYRLKCYQQPFCIKSFFRKQRCFHLSRISKRERKRDRRMVGELNVCLVKKVETRELFDHEPSVYNLFCKKQILVKDPSSIFLWKRVTCKKVCRKCDINCYSEEENKLFEREKYSRITVHIHKDFPLTCVSVSTW